MATLWAKSGTGAPSLERHTLDVMDAAEALFGTAAGPTRLGECWLRFFRIPDVPWTKFHGTLLAACGLHDWGKANDGMQDIFARKRGAVQAIRHEHLSALLIGQPAVWDWLDKREWDRDVILSAVLTHHLKAGENISRSFTFAEALSGGRSFESWHRLESFRAVITGTANRLKMPSPDLSAVPTRWSFDGLVRAERERIKKRVLGPFGDAIDPRQPGTDDHRRRLLMAVRAGLIVADAAGSGLRRTGRPVQEWLTDTLGELYPLEAYEIEESVIAKRVESQKAIGRWKDKGDGKGGWNDFQLACDTILPARALLLAPCGSGKTLAAWRWIAARLREQPARHVLFLYPTRATATEGFRDYVSWAPEGDPTLMHGTSGFDLDGMFANPDGDDPRRDRVYRVPEDEQRLFALAYWGRRVFSATVDQFLAFLQYGYGSVCMLPVLADSVVVIDEVHSFDNPMFTALKGFLKDFDVPVLCMTATLPDNRKKELVNECKLTQYPAGPFPPDLQKSADQPRYRLRRVSSQDEAEVAVRAALRAGKRVLWVVNQVKRAQAVVRRFVPDMPDEGELFARVEGCDRPVPVICYHSRFKLTDRVDRHKQTMKALKEEKGPALGVTTQVCEMSLDIDVDLLVTEECPVSSLVQWMGRCNREKEPRPLGDPATRDTAGDVLVYPPEGGDHAPYAGRDNNLLRGLSEFLDRFATGDLSQTEIDAVFQDETFPCPTLPGDGVCMFLESGPFAVAGEEEFRGGEEFNRPCVLAGDVDGYHDAKPSQKPGWVVPVPRRRANLRDPDDAAHKKLPGYLGVASDDHYHRLTGFHDESRTPNGGE